MVQDMADLYRSIDGPCMASLFIKLATEKSYNDKMEETRTALQVPCLYSLSKPDWVLERL